MKKTTTEEKIEINAAGNTVRKITTITEEYGVNEKPVIPRTKTQVIFVLDGSSSMQLGKNLTMEGFNKQIDVLKNSQEANTDFEVSLITFNDQVLKTMTHSSLENVRRLDYNSYNPYGNTALYDAIGAAINLAEERTYHLDRKNAVLIAIFTDGQENASKFYNQYSISAAIRVHAGLGNWTFTVVGPRATLHTMEALGIDKGNIAGFEPNSVESRAWVNDVISSHTMNYVGARTAGRSFSADNYSVALASVGPDPSLAHGTGVGIAVDNIAVKIDTSAAAWPFPTAKADNSLHTDSDK